MLSIALIQFINYWNTFFKVNLAPVHHFLRKILLFYFACVLYIYLPSLLYLNYLHDFIASCHLSHRLQSFSFHPIFMQLLIYISFSLSTDQEHKDQLKGTKILYFETHLRRKIISDKHCPRHCQDNSEHPQLSCTI